MTRAHLDLIAAGVGVGLQAGYIADADPRVRLLTRMGTFNLSLWLLTHEDIRSTARVRAFMSSLGESLTRDKARIEGPPI
jgi:DNA-binding transcriptional LysR family regulator